MYTAMRELSLFGLLLCFWYECLQGRWLAERVAKSVVEKWMVCVHPHLQTADFSFFSRLVVSPCSGNSMTTTLRNVRRLGEMSAEKVCLQERDGHGMVQNLGPQKMQICFEDARRKSWKSMKSSRDSSS